MNKQSVEKILKEKGEFTLRDSIRLLRKELSQFGCENEWRSFFSEDPAELDFVSFYEKELSLVNEEIKVQNIVLSMTPFIALCWNSFDIFSKEILLENYSRAPMPPINAKTLLNMGKTKQLTMIPKLQAISYSPSTNKYICKFLDGTQKSFDWIINATGSSRFITHEDSLMFILIEKGSARENLFGGLDVDFESSALIDQQGKINPYIRLVGHNTQGVFYYLSSLKSIAKHAKKIAKNFVDFIKTRK